jgi:oligopeptide transport system substrate-binding protein
MCGSVWRKGLNNFPFISASLWTRMEISRSAFSSNLLLSYLVLLLWPWPSFGATDSEKKIVSSLKVFNVRLVEDLGTLDWNYGEVNAEIVYQLMEGLFKADARGRPELGVAQSFRWAKNNSQLLVRLNPSRRWSDGSPVCAQQFVDSWERLKSKTFASPYAHFANDLKKFEAKSCRELVIDFERPMPEAPALLSHYVFFPIRLDRNGDGKAFSSGDGLVVNGPFRVKSWTKSQRLVLEPNPEFGGKRPWLEEIQFLFIPEDSTAKVLFEQKRIDWLKDVPPLLRSSQMERSSSFKQFPGFVTFYFGLNQRTKVLKSSEARSALLWALDRDQIPKILGRENRPTLSWVSKDIFPEIKAPKKRERPAKETLDLLKAAVSNGELLLRVYSKPAAKLIAEWAQGQWEKNLGIRVPLEVQEGKVYWSEITKDAAPIFLSGVTAPYGHARAFLQEFLSSSTANWTGWSSTDFDLAVREGSIQLAEEIIQRDGFVIPLYSRDFVALVQVGWQGFHINPLGQSYLDKVFRP